MSYPRLDPTAECTATSDGGHVMARDDDGEWSCLACGETADDLADLAVSREGGPRHD